jgi:transposase
MLEAGMSLRKIAQRVGHHHSTVSHIVNKHRLTNDVKDRERSGRSRITSRREDKALGRLVRRNPFANSTVLKRQLLPHRLLSARTIQNRLKSVGYRSRRPVKRCLLTQAHKAFRLQWFQTRRQWNLVSWRKVHWSDESRFLLHVTDGIVRVWRQPNTAYAERNIVETVPFGGGSVMVWGCVSYDCKLDLITVRGNLNGQIYRQNILEASVVSHFDNHPLNTRHVFMDENARPHRTRVVTDYLRDESITTLPWSARSPDLNPIEHIWDIFGRRVK